MNDVESRVTQALRDAHVPLLTTRRDAAIAWARSLSLAARPWPGACCTAGLVGAWGPGDGSSAGAPRLAPDRSDLLIFAGMPTRRLAPLVRDAWRAMAEPRYVVALGACACSGGAYDNYATLPGLDSILPVDIFIPGCPPRPEAVLEGLQALSARIRVEDRRPSADVYADADPTAPPTQARGTS